MQPHKFTYTTVVKLIWIFGIDVLNCAKIPPFFLTEWINLWQIDSLKLLSQKSLSPSS